VRPAVASWRESETEGDDIRRKLLTTAAAVRGAAASEDEHLDRLVLAVGSLARINTVQCRIREIAGQSKDLDHG